MMNDKKKQGRIMIIKRFTFMPIISKTAHVRAKPDSK